MLTSPLYPGSPTATPRRIFLFRLLHILSHMCASNDPPIPQGAPSAREPRQAAVHALRRAVAAPFATDAVLVTALVLLDRVQNRGHVVNSHSVADLLVGCVIIAGKWVEDRLPGLDVAAAAVGGLPILLALETHVLHSLGWKVWVSREEFELYATTVLGR